MILTALGVLVAAFLVLLWAERERSDARLDRRLAQIDREFAEQERRYAADDKLSARKDEALAREARALADRMWDLGNTALNDALAKEMAILRGSVIPPDDRKSWRQKP